MTDVTSKSTEDEAPVVEISDACFVDDTFVHTEYGVMEIQHVYVGLEVLSRSETTGETGYRRITKCFKHEDREVFVVNHTARDNRRELVLATAEHPFWVEGQGWVKVGQLQVGQKIEIVDPVAQDDAYRPAGQRKAMALGGAKYYAVVNKVYKAKERDTVYNFEVEEFHTYFVGAHGLFVHN